jgi:hypothetical protein
MSPPTRCSPGATSFVDRAFGLVRRNEAAGWNEIAQTMRAERPMAAVLALAEGIDGAGVTMPVPDHLDFEMDEIMGIPFPRTFHVVTRQVRFTAGIETYVAFARFGRSMIRKLHEAIDILGKLDLAGTVRLLAADLDRTIDEAFRVLKEQMQREFTRVVVGAIDGITGFQPTDHRDRTTSEALRGAGDLIEGVAQQTSLEARLLSPKDLGGMPRDQVEAMVGPVDPGPKGGWIARAAMPPSHSEISKDHAPSAAHVQTHTAGTNAGARGAPLHPGQPKGADFDIEDGSVFYGLARALAVEADRHVVQQVERMWATQGSVFGDGASLDTSKMQVTSAQFNAEATRRGDAEQQRARRAGHHHAQSAADPSQLMKRPEVRGLMNVVDLIIAHPDDSSWWKTVFDGYINANPEGMAHHIEARNSVRRNRRTL